MGLLLNKSSLDSYLDWESAQATRNFYYRGEIFAMVGARQVHGLVALNLATEFKAALRGTPCRVFINETKLRINAADCVFYPDVMVTCDARDRSTPMHVSFPKLIVEVLSDSTAAFDRGNKFAACRQIETLEEYVLVDIDTRRTETFRRGDDGLWVLHEFSGTQDVHFQSIGLTLTADALYENVEPDAAIG